MTQVSWTNEAFTSNNSHSIDILMVASSHTTARGHLKDPSGAFGLAFTLPRWSLALRPREVG